MQEEGSEFGYAKETKTAKTEQLSSAEVEESKKFVIRLVKRWLFQPDQSKHTENTIVPN